MKRKVIFSPEALRDLLQLYDYIDEREGSERATAYYNRIRAHCANFADFPERGSLRDDLRPGLRITGFRRRITLAFHVEEDRVVFDRILYGGRDLDRLFRK